MRVIRGRSDQEVSSNGFALFVVGLILAGFVGGAVRTLLTSEQIQNRILTELQAALPALQVKMESARVSLARGIWPGLSISIPHLHLTKPEACGEASGTLELENMQLPLDIWPLLKSRVRWDVVSVERLELVYSHKSCAEVEKSVLAELAVPAKSASPLVPTITDSAEQVREHISHAFAIVGQLREHIRGLSVKKAVVSSSDDSTWRVEANDLLIHTGQGIRASAKIHFEKSFRTGKIEHDASLTATASPEQMKWDVRSPLKEGLITWAGTANHLNDHLEQRLTVRQVPLKDALNEVQTISGVSPGGSARFIWISCDLSQSGSLSQMHSLPMEISDCKIDGEGEQVHVVPGQHIWPLERTPLHQPLKVQVAQLSLQTLFDLLGQEGLPAIIPQPGHWLGEIEFENPKSWKMEGLLKDLEVVFSNQSIRGKQVISQVKTKFQADGDELSATLSDPELAEGSGSGQINLQYDSAQRQGDIDVKLDALSLNPAIQTLMVGGVSQPMNFNGKGHFERGGFTDWQGRADWPATEGHGWKVTNPRVETNFKAGIFAIRFRAQSAELAPEFPFFDVVKSVLGDPAAGVKSWTLHDANSLVLVAHAGGVIREARATGGGHGLRFQGQWERGGELVGQLTSAGSHEKKWKIRGWNGRVAADLISP